MNSLFAQSSEVRKLREAIGNSEKVNVSGLVGSALSLTIANVFKGGEKPFLFILNDKLVLRNP